MSEIVCVRFKQCGKLYDFESGEMTLKPGDMVVVESELGLSIGKVVRKSLALAEKAGGEQKEAREYKRVLRMASEEDIRESRANAGIEKEAFDVCRERVMARGLQMKLIRTEAALDRKRIIFYFISEKRIDFRELVKDLAQRFRTRIEMRQVGVRDEAKMTGGLGMCGRELCCASFLSNFAPISIKMAKKQELVLNTGKLSGTCGRLMCCLNYEYGNKTCGKEAEKEVPAEETAGEVFSPEGAVTGASEVPSGALQQEKEKEHKRQEQRTEARAGGKREASYSRGERPGKRTFSGPRTQERGPEKEKTQTAQADQAAGDGQRGRQGQQEKVRRPRPHPGLKNRPAQRPPVQQPGSSAQDAQGPLQAVDTGAAGLPVETAAALEAQKKKKKKKWRKRGPRAKNSTGKEKENQDPAPEAGGPSGAQA